MIGYPVNMAKLSDNFNKSIWLLNKIFISIDSRVSKEIFLTINTIFSVNYVIYSEDIFFCVVWSIPLKLQTISWIYNGTKFSLFYTKIS